MFQMLTNFIMIISQYIQMSNHYVVWVCKLSHVRLFPTLWTVAHQDSLSVGFPRQGYSWELPFPSPGDIPNPGVEPTSPVSPALAGGFFTTEPPGKPQNQDREWFSFVKFMSSSCCSVAKLCLTLCDPMDHSTPSFHVPHHLLELA